MLPPSPIEGGLYAWMEETFEISSRNPPVPDWVYDAILAPTEPAMAQSR
jgi:hypothetical protein